MKHLFRGVVVLLSLLGSVSSAEAAITYTYDTLGRVIRVDFATNQFIVYTYDAAGNRITVSTSSPNGGAPIAIPDTVNVHENHAKNWDPRSNDSNPQNATLTITSVGVASHGTVVINSGTSLSYTPLTGYTGADSFLYGISDGQGHNSSALETISVGDLPPVAVADSQSVNENAGSDAGSSVTYDSRANDSDPDGDPITIQSAGTAGHGTVTINGGGTSLTYAPASGYSGSDSFTYTINDGLGQTATATDTMTVVNRAPTANSISVSMYEYPAPGAAGTVTFDPRTNATDPEGDALSIVPNSCSTPAHGSVSSGCSNVSITYLVNNYFHGSDSFTYQITDGHGNNATGTAYVTVINRAPTANNDSYSAVANFANTYDPRANDSDPESDALTIISASTPGHGSVVVNGGTSVTYTPTNGYTGPDSFNYTIQDAVGNTASATVSLTVAVGTSPPVAVDDNVELDFPPNSINFDPRWNDSDPYGYPITITGKTNGAHGTVTIVGGGTSLTYQKTSGTSDSFTYTISDPYGHTATAHVYMTFVSGGCQTC